MQSLFMIMGGGVEGGRDGKTIGSQRKEWSEGYRVTSKQGKCSC